MAQTSITDQFTNLLATTLRKHMPTVIDNIYKSRPLWARLYKADMIQEHGGTYMVVPIHSAKNSTVASYPPFGVLATAQTQILNVAQFTWRHTAGTVTVAPEHIAQNAGDEKAVDMVKTLVTGLKNSLIEGLSDQILAPSTSAGNGGLDLDPLALMIHTDPTAATVYGGIDPSAETYWRNKFFDSTASATWAALKKDIHRIVNDCSRGTGGYPDFAVCDINTWEALQAATASLQRYTTEGTEANIGFKSLSFAGLDVFFDETCPNAKALNTTTSGADNGTMYVFNSQFMHVAVLRGRNFDLSDFVEVQDQTSRTAKVTWSGIVYTDNRRKQGVLFGIDNTTATS